jgi:predicted transcriptional regulator
MKFWARLILSTRQVERDKIMSWFAGMKKNRSKFGKWLDSRGIKQADLAKKSKVSAATITRLCNESTTRPTRENALKIVRALKDLAQEEVSTSRFWDDVN